MRTIFTESATYLIVYLYSIVIRPPGMVVPGGRMFYCWWSEVCSNLGALPKENLRAKNVQSSAQFRTTSDWPRFGTDVNIQNRKNVIDSDSSSLQQNKFGELRSTNNTVPVLHVDSDPSKSTFPEDHILTCGWCYPLKFLHALDNEQRLLYISTLDGGLPNNFNSNFGASGE